MTIKFGPAGLGPTKEAIKNLEEYKKLGLTACEIAFTYSVYIKNEKDMEKIKKAAQRLGVSLSIHAPYFINLNSTNKQKLEMSKKRILSCCEVGEKLGAKTVVFHCGYYQKIDKEKTYENIKNAILDIQKEKWIELIKNLPEDKDIVIINESPDMIEDSVEGLKISKSV